MCATDIFFQKKRRYFSKPPLRHFFNINHITIVTTDNKEPTRTSAQSKLTLLLKVGPFDVNATCPSYTCKNFNKTQITCKTLHVSDAKKGGGRKHAFSSEEDLVYLKVPRHNWQRKHTSAAMWHFFSKYYLWAVASKNKFVKQTAAAIETVFLKVKEQRFNVTLLLPKWICTSL